MPLQVSDITAGMDAHRTFASSQTAQIANLISMANTLANANIWKGGAPSPMAVPPMPALPPMPTPPILPKAPPIVRPGKLTPPLAEPIKFEPPDKPAAFTEQLGIYNTPPTPAQLRAFTKAPPQLGQHPLPPEPGDFREQAPRVSPLNFPNAPSDQSWDFKAELPETPDIDGQVIADALSRALEQTASSLNNDMNTVTQSIRDRLMAGYESKIATIQRKLTELMDGKGIYAPAVEDAIYERSKSKTNAESTRVQQDALLTAARRGFTLPTGALMSAMQQARQAGADNNAQAAREIVVQQAELQQKNMQFALNQLMVYDKLIVDATNGFLSNYISARAQNVQIGVAAANAMEAANKMLVEMYAMGIKTYEAQAGVFEAQIRAASLQIEAYKGRIEAERAKVDVDVAQIKVFEAKVNAYQAQVGAYSKRLEAVSALANIDKVKVDAFTAEVGAFSAEANAKSAEWQGYAASFTGQKADAEAFAAKAQAYATQVNAYRAMVEAEGERMKALGMSNESKFKSHEALLRIDIADVDAQKAVSTAVLEQDKMLIDSYDVNSRAVIAKANLELEKYKAEVSKSIESYKTSVERYLREAEIGSRANIAAANANMDGAQVYGTLVSGAMSGINGVLSAAAT